jgi:hypothetical protein
MTKVKDLLGFEVEYSEKHKVYEICDFPNFSDETPQSKRIFEEIEIMNFNSKKVNFPIKVDILQRIKDVSFNDIMCFTFRDLFDIIKKDENLFLNTNTFFKIHLEHENEICVFSIMYYTINENGTNTINNTNELLEITKTHFRKKKFIKKFVENKKLKNHNCPNFLEYIPVIPLLWLEYNQNNKLCFMKYFETIETLEYDTELPF